MLRQFLVGAAVSVCNIVIHALVMTAVVRVAHRRIRIHPAGPITGARKTPPQSQRLIYVSVATISVLMAWESGEIRRRGGERSFRRERMNYKRLIHVAPFQD